MTTAAAPGWIVGARFDLAWIFGGALLSLLALALTVGLGASMAGVFWIWLLGFDGPHMAATYARTYLDRGEWGSRARLLLGSLACFAVGPICLAAGAALHEPGVFLAFLGFAATYGYYHVVRQHYGFLALYKTKQREPSRLHHHLDKWCLYIGCWLPYVYFLLTHPRARAMMAIQGGTLDAPALRFSLLAATLLAPLVLVGSTLSRPSAQRNLRALAYGLLVLVLHALIYLVAGRFEPVYAASTGPDTDFLLLSVMVTIFHNVQYVALVWSYNRRRHSETPVEERDLAAWLSRSIPRYLAACAAFSIVYFALASSTGVYPGLRIFEHRVLGDVSWNQVGLALWWGLALHHYVLDQCIWRVSKDARLRAELNVA